MVVNKLRDRYRVDLVGLQAACEANYARLMRLVPDMRNEPEARRIAVTQGEAPARGSGARSPASRSCRPNS